MTISSSISRFCSRAVLLLQSPYLNPTLQGLIGQARLTASTGYSNYNALQASFQQRLSHGLQFQANYTWSKCMGNSSGFYAQYGDTNASLTQAGNNTSSSRTPITRTQTTGSVIRTWQVASMVS